MTQPDFTTALEMELQFRGVAFDRADVLTFAADVWPLAEEDPDSGRWADAFLQAQRDAAADMTYSAWGKDGVADTLIKGDQLPDESFHDPDLQLMKVFQASSWNDAMRQYHEWQGWEPYQPMLDEDGNEYPDQSATDSTAGAYDL